MNSNERSADRPLRVARVAATIGILAYAASWLANLCVPGFHDPLWLRVAVIILLGATIVGTYRSPWVVRHLPEVLRTLVYVITVHDYVLVYWNQLDALQVVGTYLVLAGVVATASLIVTRPRHLTEYLAFVAVLSILVSATVTEARTPKAQFLIGIAAFTALSYVAVRAHLQTLRRLEEAQRLLLEDIARLRLVEQALRDSETQARAVLHAVPDVLVRVGRDGVVRAVLGDARGELDDRAREGVGHRLDELLDRPRAEVAAFLEAEPGTVARSFSAPIRRAADAGPLHVEVRLVGRDPESSVALLRDVTHERKLEERLRIQDRLAAIGTLASGVAHEINNPLSYVVSNVIFATQGLRRRIEATPDAEVEEELKALDDAHEGAKRIGDIVRGLKNYALGVESLELSADAGECVDNALRILETHIRHHGAVVAVELAGMPRLRAEPFRLTQVLVNLISNAIQALPGPGREGGQVWIRGRAGDGAATLEVVDDGCGIRAADVPGIFDPFYSTKQPGEGTGLGLYVCHQIIGAFGGTIDVASEEGVGTTFRVVLPAIDDAPLAVGV